ncbi:MAG TPA: hypothetical protein ENN40_08635 [Candidatus Aminicenantes bacterium]|nr:hypothetical protein [Candidatus Aminicenantes bacterium]
MSVDDAGRLASVLGNRSWGVFLRSDPFIFNIFDFEHLPRGAKKQRELAQWRLEKVFPEDLSNFIHTVLHPGGKRLLSVLLPLRDAGRVEDWFREHPASLTFLGNSTLELMNRLWAGGLAGMRKQSPQVMIELDHQLGVAVFQESSRPYYMRKFRCDSEQMFLMEVRKTLEYVKSNYSRTPRSVAFFPGRPKFAFSNQAEIWRQLNLTPFAIPGGAAFAMSGAG